MAKVAQAVVKSAGSEAGAKTPEIMSVGEIQHLIREAGREPIERDTLYRKVDRTADGFTLGEKITAGV